MYITEAGKKLLEYAKNVLAEFDKLEEGMSAFKDVKTLRIGVTVTVGTNFISKVLSEFKENTKNVETYIRKINVTWEASSPEVIKQAVINDGCVTVASLRLFEKEIQSGEMYAFRNKTKEWNRSFSVVYHKNRKLPEYALQK